MPIQTITAGLNRVIDPRDISVKGKANGSSAAAGEELIPVLETYGFISDPNGIRAMGLDLKQEGEREKTSMEGLEPPTFRTGI